MPNERVLIVEDNVAREGRPLQTMLEKGTREDWFQSDLICWLAFFAATGTIAFVMWELRHPHPAVRWWGG